MPRKSRKRKHPGKYALLYGDEEIGRGTESEMNKLRQWHKDYATEEKPIRVVRTLKRPIGDVIDLATGEDLREDAKRLRLEQDVAYETCLAADKERECNERQKQEWEDRYGEPENRALLFDELFKTKNDRYKACLERVKM